jgi:uncharacterized membrane protein (DUF2068 family)
MSAPYVPANQAQPGAWEYDYDDRHGQGLVTFAGVMLLIAAVLNTLYGIAAIGKAHVFVHNARYVFGDLNTWGWFMLGLGIVQGLAAFGIWRGTSWARWFGVGSAAVNAILQTFWIPAYPVLAMTILTLDVVVIYGLLAHGGRRKPYREAQERERERVAVAR